MFCRVAETKSFSAAARSFETTTSAVSKRIAALEAHLGVRLFARTTRRVSLTEPGATLYAHASRILTELADAEESVAQLGGSTRGTLRVTAPTILGEHHVAALVPKLLAAHPELRIELSLTDRVVNLVEEGFDCGVRIGPLRDSSLVAARVGEVQSVVCASPSYLATHGTPEEPHDLSVHDCIRLVTLPVGREWSFRDEGGEELIVPVSGRLLLNSGVALVAAVRAGVGLSRLPRFLVEDALDRGELVEVLADFRTPPSPVHVVYPTAARVPPKLRAFVDLLKRAGGVGGRASGRRR